MSNHEEPRCMVCGQPLSREMLEAAIRNAEEMVSTLRAELDKSPEQRAVKAEAAAGGPRALSDFEPL